MRHRCQNVRNTKTLGRHLAALAHPGLRMQRQHAVKIEQTVEIQIEFSFPIPSLAEHKHCSLFDLTIAWHVVGREMPGKINKNSIRLQ